MTAATDNHRDNILIGSGELFIDVLDSAGERTGERYLGDAVGATLSVASERVQVFSGSGPVARQIVNKVRSLTRTLAMTLHDMSLENMALFVGAPDPVEEADKAVRVEAAGAEKIGARKGRWYQLGVSDARPAGVRAVKDEKAGAAATGAHNDGADAVIVTTAAAAPDAGNTLARAANYAVDKDRGRIFIKENAPGLPVDGVIYVHYKPVAAADRKQVAATALREVRAAVRYIEDTQTGRGRNIYAPLCSVSAGGEMALMSRENEQQLQVSCEILDPGAGRAALLIDEQAA